MRIIHEVLKTKFKKNFRTMSGINKCYLLILLLKNDLGLEEICFPVATELSLALSDVLNLHR